MCGSAMRAVMQGADQILAGSAQVVVAGGLESMSNAPYLLPKARAGYRMGNQEVLDHMFYDGLQSPWDGPLMGCFAAATPDEYAVTRQAQDEFAAESVRRALAAINSGQFAAEIAAVATKSRKGEALVDKDETPFTLDIAKIPSLKPAFKKDGTVTAASSSGISDGAAAVVLTRESFAGLKRLKPLARVLGYASFAREPEWFTLAPVGAIQKLLSQLVGVTMWICTRSMKRLPRWRWQRDETWDWITKSECQRRLRLGHDRRYRARILTTLLYALKARGKRRGLPVCASAAAKPPSQSS